MTQQALTPRRKLDQYYTPETLVTELINHVSIFGNVLEPCVGNGQIAAALLERRPVFTRPVLTTNDIDYTHFADFHEDATDYNSQMWYRPRPDWVITNPPFNVAMPILENAWLHCRFGIAFLLRLTFLEPTAKRQEWLKAHSSELSNLIIFGSPRPSFTDDGKTDSVTTAWAVWRKGWNKGTEVTFATLSNTV